MIRALLILLATLSVAQAQTLHCPGGCLPNVGPPFILSPSGIQVPQQCACNWDDAIVADLNLLNAAGTIPISAPVNNNTVDATAAINAATFTKATSGGRIALAAGTYLISSPIKVYSGQILEGDGCAFDGTAWHGTILKMTGSTGYCGIESASPPTCTTGAGACDATLGTSARGTGCVCYGNTDCTSGSCTGGTSVRGVTIRNLCVQIQVDKSCGIDLLGINESDVYDGFIFADASGATDITGIRASDAQGILSGYSNTIRNWRMGGTSGSKTMKIGVRVMAQANNTTIRENRMLGNIAVGIQTDPDPGNGPPLNTHILQNAVETFTTDSILDQAKGTTIEGNYCESGGALTNPCLHLNNSTSVQIRYNFFTPSGLTQPVLFSGSTTTPTQWGSESNVVDTAKFSNVFGNFDFQDFDWQPRGAAPVSCTSTQVGRVYYSNVQHTLCRCDTFAAALKWCPVECDVSGPTCSPGTFTCGAGQTASTCG